MLKKNDSSIRNKSSRKSESSALLIAICICFTFSIFFVSSNYICSNQRAAVVLLNKINPNSSPVTSLMRLPGIGRAKAQAIVDYRNNIIENNRASKVFNSADDLLSIKGIGPKTVEKIGSYLQFE